jgi:hypothetical protein
MSSLHIGTYLTHKVQANAVCPVVTLTALDVGVIYARFSLGYEEDVQNVG